MLSEHAFPTRSPTKRPKPGAPFTFIPRDTLGSPPKHTLGTRKDTPQQDILALGAPSSPSLRLQVSKTTTSVVMVRERDPNGSQPGQSVQKERGVLQQSSQSSNERVVSSSNSSLTNLGGSLTDRFARLSNGENIQQSSPLTANQAAKPASSFPQIVTGLDINGNPVASQRSGSTPATANMSKPVVSKPATASSVFGQTSRLQNPLDRTSGGLFNIRKQGRPEHHKLTGSSVQPRQYRRPDYYDPAQPSTNSLSSEVRPADVDQVRQMFGSHATSSATHIDLTGQSPDVYIVPRPSFVQPAYRSAVPRPTFTASFKAPSTTLVDLTNKDEDEIDPDDGLRDLAFGAPDPYSYVDAGQAQENIKTLLEGAFDDEEGERPRLRRRKVKQTSANPKELKGLAERLKGLNVADATRAEQDREDIENGDEEDGTVEGLAVKLLPHQIEGVAWMLDKETTSKKRTNGGILADDMGLGKTIQSVALMLANPRSSHSDDLQVPKKDRVPSSVSKSTLVIAPLALIKQWESEIKDKVEHGHGLRVLVHHGPSRTKRGSDLQKYDVVITTYQTLTSEHAASEEISAGIKTGCFGVNWYRIFLDEAHSIKNRNAKSTKACYALNSHYRWCLTGTPMQNNLDELQSLIRFLGIKPYDDYSNWKNQITTPLKNNRGNLAMRRIQVFLKACMKRRTKDVLRKDGALNSGGKSKEGEKNKGFQIVERKVEIVSCDFDEYERRSYTKLANNAQSSLKELMRGEKQDYIGALVLLLRLRQACNHPELANVNVMDDEDAVPKEAIPATPGRQGRVDDTEVDDIANLMGGLSVKVKDRKERRQRMRQIVDSDDDSEGEGSWLVPEAQQRKVVTGRSGDTDDENAEGGGEWLGSQDEDTDSEAESVNRAKKLQSRARRRSRISDVETISSSASDDNQATTDNSIISIPATQARAKLTASTKIRHLIKLLKAETPEHKVIVFSQFTSMLDLIEPFLRAQHLNFTRYDGKMRNDLREASLDKLRNDPNTRILLCSLKCGSLGLNLTAASRVIIMEPFWNPFVEEQAIDRVHRINQTKPVHVYRLTIADTVEERILELQEAKRKLAKTALEGGKANMGISMADILKLFSREAEHSHPIDSPDEDENQGGGDGAHAAVATGGRLGYLDNLEAQEKRAREKAENKRRQKRADDPVWGRR